MPNEKLISVVVPSYNHARFIEQAIRSILDQDYGRVEIIIVDDGSTDESARKIRDIISEPRGRHIEFIEQENRGAHAAIACGLSKARGDILTILNSDDAYQPSRFSRMMNVTPNDSDFIAFSKVTFIDDDGRPMGKETGIARWYSRALRQAAECPTVGYALLRNNFSVTSGNLFFTRGLYEKVGKFGAYKLCHDWDFLMRATHFVEPIFVQESLMYYRVHQANTLHSTQHLLLTEGVPAINTFVGRGRIETAPNRLCPGWAYWPLYFDHFIDTRSSWFSDAPIRHFVSETPPRLAPRDLSPWQDATAAGVTDLGFLTSTCVPGTALDAYAFRREMVLQQSSVQAAALAVVEEAAQSPVPGASSTLLAGPKSSLRTLLGRIASKLAE